MVGLSAHHAHTAGCRSSALTAPRVQASLLKLLPPHAEMSKKRFGTCAVVGSSPELLMYEDGANIDEADAIFRANLAVVDGFEKYAGGRTTVRIINPVESVQKARTKDKKVTRRRPPLASYPPHRDLLPPRCLPR